jgi:ABC-type bacteriocin/lantibiotic exporter with double-glycine peptidase domain
LLLDVERVSINKLKVFNAELKFLVVGVLEPSLAGSFGTFSILLVVLSMLSMLSVLVVLVVLSMLVTLLVMFSMMIRTVVTAREAVRSVQENLGRDVSSSGSQIEFVTDVESARNVTGSAADSEYTHTDRL